MSNERIWFPGPDKHLHFHLYPNRVYHNGPIYTWNILLLKYSLFYFKISYIRRVLESNMIVDVYGVAIIFVVLIVDKRRTQLSISFARMISNCCFYFGQKMFFLFSLYRLVRLTIFVAFINFDFVTICLC